MKIIAGLGNPGLRYRSTRHNVGCMVLDVLAGKYRLRFRERKYSAAAAVGNIEGEPVMLIKPLTYMNLSGRSVFPAISGENLPLENLLVICDDIELPLGRVRFRSDGGSGGHNGLKSIITETGTTEFSRFRLGVGRPDDPRIDVADYVLRPFGRSERAELVGMLERACEGTACWIREGIDSAMNLYN